MTAEPYEEALRRGGAFAIEQIGRFFQGIGPVHQTLKVLVAELERTRTPYAITGATALNAHGYRRATDDVDVLLTAGTKESFISSIDPALFIPGGKRHRYVRDGVTGVRVDLYEPPLRIMVKGPEQFRTFNPPHASVVIDGIRYLDLSSLMATKLIHGIHGPAVMKHMSDVVASIKYLNLPLDFAGTLPEDVRPKFIDFWNAMQFPDPHEQGRPW